jgi:hypothetical protein
MHRETPIIEKGTIKEENVILFPSLKEGGPREGPIHCWEGLGGLLRYYYREAA